ncbi:MAG: galactosyltransferase-related protein [Phormidesmis sp.]
MSKVSVLTLTRHRTDFLKNLLNGLARSSRLPDECIVVHMNEPAQSLGQWPFPCHHHTLTSDTALPLTQARNAAAKCASGDSLIFLDVDCIPSRTMVAAYERACQAVPDSIAMAKVNYLSQNARIDWTAPEPEAALRSQSKPHPMRNIHPVAPLILEFDYGLFWSLSFGLTRSLFNLLGGFSDGYIGYGAEDTDFAWKAKAMGIPLLWVPDAIAYHQFHTSSVPPWHNFDSIVHNAQVFYARWDKWPMESWLAAFAAKGYIEWTIAGSTLAVLERPLQARSLTLKNNVEKK